MFVADCPTKRAAIMTDMARGRWSHVPATILTVRFSMLEIKLFSIARCLEFCYTLILLAEIASE